MAEYYEAFHRGFGRTLRSLPQRLADRWASWIMLLLLELSTAVACRSSFTPLNNSLTCTPKLAKTGAKIDFILPRKDPTEHYKNCKNSYIKQVLPSAKKLYSMWEKAVQVNLFHFSILVFQSGLFCYKNGFGWTPFSQPFQQISKIHDQTLGIQTKLRTSHQVPLAKIPCLCRIQ
jgi:hypothetical protein